MRIIRENVSEDSLQFSRIEQLHHLLYAYVVHDEEDELLSSKLRTQREFPWFNINRIPLVHRNGSRWRASRFPSFWFCFLPFDRLAKSPAFNLTHILRTAFLRFPCSMLLKFITNFFDPWEILTHEWELSLFTTSIKVSTPYLPCK